MNATYVLYLGWFDGNPATLHVHPPVEASKRYVEYMGGAEAVLANVRADFDKGDYRSVAEAVNHGVFADPKNQEARDLQADALEQLGYRPSPDPGAISTSPAPRSCGTGSNSCRHRTRRALIRCKR